MKRFIVFSILAAALFAAFTAARLIYVSNETVSLPTMAKLFEGERWFVLRLLLQPIGSYQTTNKQGSDGNWHFSSTMVFRLQEGDPTTIKEDLVFSGHLPYQLISADQYRQKANGQTHQSTIRRKGDLLVGGSEDLPLQGDFTLSDYLGIESWIRNSQPTIGESSSVQQLDFDHMRLRRITWTVKEENAEGYIIESNNHSQATTIKLGPELVPQQFRISDFLVIDRVPNAEAAEIWHRSPSLFHDADLQIPLNTSIQKHESLSHLTLSLESNAEDLGPWADIANEHLLIESKAARELPAELDDIEHARRETIHYPKSAPSVQHLSQNRLFQLNTPRLQAEALTLFVHQYLQYDETQNIQSVIDTISSRRGDCADYANLFTTLGRSLGLPTQTIIGLAYNANLEAFSLHAWNRVAIDGNWQEFDPTWNQISPDASHIPLPQGNAIALMSLMPSLRFQLVNAEYFN